MNAETLEPSFRLFVSQIRASSLYERRYGYYAFYLFLVLLGTALGFFLMSVSTNIFFQIGNGIFLGFVFVQGGMLGHDLAHHQVFKSIRTNAFCASLTWGLLGGLSERKWFKKHNEHHLYVNQVDKDPDLNIPFVFSGKQLEGGGRHVTRFLLPYQHIVFFLLLPFVYGGMLVQSFRYIFQDFSPRLAAELSFITIHFVVLIGALFFFLPWTSALAFLVAHFALIGVYMSLVFAPNHKGEEILAPEEIQTWLTQITSTRNVYPSSFIFHVFGGLNYQIEHHLFTDMARPNYAKVGPLVKAYCRENSIPYHEASWAGSLREIYLSLKAQADLTRAVPALVPIVIESE